MFYLFAKQRFIFHFLAALFTSHSLVQCVDWNSFIFQCYSNIVVAFVVVAGGRCHLVDIVMLITQWSIVGSIAATYLK